MTLFWIIYIAFVGFMIATMWKIFAKAGEPGWACLVPIYNTCVWLKIAGKPMWWFFLLPDSCRQLRYRDSRGDWPGKQFRKRRRICGRAHLSADYLLSHAGLW